jgi:hypothetical protein
MSNPVKLAPGMDIDGNAQREFDVATQETIARNSAAQVDEDFLGAGHLAAFPTSPTIGYPWVAKIVGTTPTVGIVANQPGGVAAVALTSGATQEAVLYAGDQLNWDMTKYASFEARLALSVLPTGVAELVWGFHSAYVAGPDNTTQYLDFQVLGNGAVNVRIKDGVSSPQSFVSGVTLVAGVFHNFRIDVSSPANVVFYIDGKRVGPAPPLAPMTFAATGANAILQPYFVAFKGATADVGTMQIDMVQAGMNRA